MTQAFAVYITGRSSISLAQTSYGLDDALLRRVQPDYVFVGENEQPEMDEGDCVAEWIGKFEAAGYKSAERLMGENADLLEACKAAIIELKDMWFETEQYRNNKIGPSEAVMAQLEAAIAKAEGG